MRSPARRTQKHRTAPWVISHGERVGWMGHFVAVVRHRCAEMHTHTHWQTYAVLSSSREYRKREKACRAISQNNSSDRDYITGNMDLWRQKQQSLNYIGHDWCPAWWRCTAKVILILEKWFKWIAFSHRVSHSWPLTRLVLDANLIEHHLSQRRDIGPSFKRQVIVL